MMILGQYEIAQSDMFIIILRVRDSQGVLEFSSHAGLWGLYLESQEGLWTLEPTSRNGMDFLWTFDYDTSLYRRTMESL